LKQQQPGRHEYEYQQAKIYRPNLLFVVSHRQISLANSVPLANKRVIIAISVSSGYKMFGQNAGVAIRLEFA
jgi:hypothetical protein